MKSKKILALMVLAALVTSLGACITDDDVKDIVEYNLRIENDTSSAFDIYIDNQLDSHGAYPAGHVAANQHTIIHELDIGVNYIVHLVNPGDDFDSPVHEKNVHSAGGDMTWTIN